MENGGIELGFDAAERRTFLLLAAGHLLFAAALFTVAPLIEENGLYAIAPLFGVPLALLGRGDRRLVRALVLVVGFGLVHYGAVYCAVKSVRVPFTGEGFTDSLWIPGAIGGLIGAAGSFALCALAGLLRPGSRAMLAAGVAVLTAVGAVGVYMLMSRMGTTDGKGSVASYLFIYTPWQLAFAWFLAKLLRN
jgi:hypothetical protein